MMLIGRPCAPSEPFPFLGHRTVAEVLDSIRPSRSDVWHKNWNEIDTAFAIDRWAHGMSTRQIGVLLGIPWTRVMARIANLRRRMDQRLLAADRQRHAFTTPRQMRTREFPGRRMTAVEREAAFARAVAESGERP